MKTQNKAYLYASLAVLFWSTVATAFKIALGELTVIQLLFYSSFVSSLALLFLLLLTGKLKFIKKLNSKTILRYAITGFLNPFLYYLVLFEAYRLLPAQEALSLNYTWAVMIVVFSIIFLKQKISIIAILSIILSFAGVVIIATKGNIIGFEFNNLFGTLLAFGSSIIWASYWIINLKDDRTDELIKLFLGFTFGFIFVAIYSLLTTQQIFPISLNGLFASVYIGLFEMSITFYFWLIALRLSQNTAKVSSLVFLSPFISLNLISIILGETILLSTIIGLIFIILGIIISRFR